MELLVEASAAEAEAISAALAAAAARKNNGNNDKDLHERDRGAEASPSGKPLTSSIGPVVVNKSSIVGTSIHSPQLGVRLHHRAASLKSILCELQV